MTGGSVPPEPRHLGYEEVEVLFRFRKRRIELSARELQKPVSGAGFEMRWKRRYPE